MISRLEQRATELLHEYGVQVPNEAQTLKQQIPNELTRMEFLHVLDFAAGGELFGVVRLNDADAIREGERLESVPLREILVRLRKVLETNRLPIDC